MIKSLLLSFLLVSFLSLSFLSLSFLGAGCSDSITPIDTRLNLESRDLWVPLKEGEADLSTGDTGLLMGDRGSSANDRGSSASDRGSSANDMGLVEVEGDMNNETSPLTDAMLFEEPIDAEIFEEIDAIPSPPPLAEFAHLDTVIDLARNQQNVWAYFIHVDWHMDTPRFQHIGYTDTAHRTDFWPASTIKFFTATAALVILEAANMSIDAQVIFWRQSGGQWIEDVELSMREIIRRTFNCSSNEAYTLLLRLAGLDWINEEFLTPSNGFDETALMRGYVVSTARPWVYRRDEPQRIILRENGREVVREHTWSGLSYADRVGCTIYNETGTGNCTSPHDLAEHMRRVMYHEYLPPQERFSIGEEALNWLRYGGPERILNNGTEECGGPGWRGMLNVFPEGEFFHKSGLVSQYRLDLMHVRDMNTGVQYILAAALDSPSTTHMAKISEEVARMARTPSHYVHLDYLRDHVNPVTADLVVYSEHGGALELITKPYAEDGFSSVGWTPLVGTQVEVPLGSSAHHLVSSCLDVSEQVHIRGLMSGVDGVVAQSDLHYVIIDMSVPCP